MTRRRTGGSRRTLVGSLLLALMGGSAMSVQARVTAGLTTDLGSAVYAAAWSFGTCLILTLILVAGMPSARKGVPRLIDALRTGRIPWWSVLGGIIGAAWVLTQGLSAGVIGVALFTIAAVAGQSLGGLVLDHWGVAGMPRRSATVLRVLGSVLAIAAVVLASWGVVEGAEQWWYFLLPAGVGALIGWQHAISGRIRAAASSWVVSVTVNVSVGVVVLTGAAAVQYVTVGPPVEAVSAWWHLSGGVLGLFILCSQVTGVRRLGVLVLNLTLIVGQLVAALAIDLVSPVSGHDPNQNLFIGAGFGIPLVSWRYR